jgi:hypothetical protein
MGLLWRHDDVDCVFGRGIEGLRRWGYVMWDRERLLDWRPATLDLAKQQSCPFRFAMKRS